MVDISRIENYIIRRLEKVIDDNYSTLETILDIILIPFFLYYNMKWKYEIECWNKKD